MILEPESEDFKFKIPIVTSHPCEILFHSEAKHY